MKELNMKLKELIDNTKGKSEIIKSIKNKKTIVPFCVETNLLAYFLSIGELSYDKYMELIVEYCKRNKYLNLYEMAPCTYGKTWIEKHIRSIFPEFIKATKKNLSIEYPNFNKEFDLWLDGIRIEIKACRANNTETKGSLASRAYLHAEAKEAGFRYHYQQLKPSCCDIFIWVGTCRDELIYWILTSKEVRETGKLSPQHRNKDTGAVGAEAEIFEGQIFMTEEELKPFMVEEKDILKKVREKCKKTN